MESAPQDGVSFSREHEEKVSARGKLEGDAVLSAAGSLVSCGGDRRAMPRRAPRNAPDRAGSLPSNAARRDPASWQGRSGGLIGSGNEPGAPAPFPSPRDRVARPPRIGGTRG